MRSNSTGRHRSLAVARWARRPSGSITKPKPRRWPPNRTQLDALIADATIDAYGEPEQRIGFYTMLMDNLVVPFDTTVLGMTVVVERLEISPAEQLVAICRRGVMQQRIGILELPLPKPVPVGAEWIEAYRRWSAGAE
jgi:hypothetical protein